MAKQLHEDETREKYRPQGDVKIDEEIDAALSDLSLDNLYETVGAAKRNDAGGGRKRGTVMSVDQKKDEVFIDFGGKTQGVIAHSAFPEPPRVGEEREFEVERFDAHENLLLLRLPGAASASVTWDNMEIGQVVEGVVTGVNKGGLELEVKSMRAFMPSGQVDLYFQGDLEQFKGQKMIAEVTQFDKHAKNLIISRRNVLEREKEASKQKMMNEVEVGQVRRGTVRSVLDFGAFVDLGGLDGLLHVSEMSHRRGIKPDQFVKVGDSVEVKIVKFDKETGKLSLSLKSLMADPWVGAQDRYAVGTTITGRVSRVESFGAFIEVEEGVEGLLSISEMSWKRIKAPSEIVKEGDTLKLYVISVDAANKRISFSLKQAGPDPWTGAKDRYPQDTIIAGRVTRVADFGAFVELEPGLEGLVHVSELSNQRVRSPGDVVKAGDEVNVRIMDIDPEQRRVSLSIRRAAEIAAAPVAPTSDQPKKKRPVLRGGLDR